MSIVDRIRDALIPPSTALASSPSSAISGPIHAASGSDSHAFTDLTDPYLIPFLRGEGSQTKSGAVVNARSALFNTTAFRCVDLISSAIGMLPLKLRLRLANGDSETAFDHPLYDVLYDEPNTFQTAYEFRTHMQAMALIHDKGAFARILWYRAGPNAGRVQALIPLDPQRVTVSQSNVDFTVAYEYSRADGSKVPIASADMFHLRGLTLDGINSLSRVKVAAEAIGLAQAAQEASARMFTNGAMVGGAVKVKGVLSDEAHLRLKNDLSDRHTGTENAHKWMVLEEDMDLVPVGGNGRDQQALEQRKHQIEEIARVFGVPRPLVGMDDTSWGSGIEALSQGFVRYSLSPWFVAWEQAIARCLLSRNERREGYYAKFNAGALLRGSMKDQAEFFAKALGSGGSKPWMTQNEVREAFDQNRHPDGDDLDAVSAPKPETPEGEEGAGAVPPPQGDD